MLLMAPCKSRLDLDFVAGEEELVLKHHLHQVHEHKGNVIALD